jgi:hypothetical protein
MSDADDPRENTEVAPPLTDSQRARLLRAAAAAEAGYILSMRAA